MAGDANYASVSLLLHGDGVNNATTFPDNSFAPKTVTPAGNAKVSTTQSKFGGASIYLDGAGDYLTVGSPSDWTSMHTSSAKWTVEMWIKPDNWTSGKTLFSTSNGSTGNSGLYCAIDASTRTINLEIYRAVASSFVINGSFSGVIPNDTNQHHIAITYDYSLGSANATLWIDGVASGTLSKTGNAPSAAAATAALKIGGFSTTGDYAGYIDDFRITDGIIRYSGTFTPHTIAHPNGAATVGGVIRDDTGAVCSRVVRIMRRDTGAVLGTISSDSGTGAYEFSVPTTDEVDVIVHDDAAGTVYNDLILRVIPA